MLSNYSYSLILIFISSIIGAIFSILLFRKLKFDPGRGKYVGALPFIFPLAVIMFLLNPHTSGLSAIFAATCALAITGFLRDYFRFSYQSLIPYEIIIVATSFIAHFDSLKIAIPVTIWAMTLILCLRLASLVYEMPAILISVTCLNLLIYSTHSIDISNIYIFTYFLLLFLSLMLLILSGCNKRYLIGVSGLNTTGYILANLTFTSKRLLMFSLLLPSMAILFPFVLICSMIIITFFGNKLHSNQSSGNYFWSLKREQVVVFTGLIFLCLNFLLLLVQFKSPFYGYVALFLLLISSLFSFFNTFARRLTDNTRSENNNEVNILGINVFSKSKIEAITSIENYLSDKKEQKLFHVVTADSLALVRMHESVNFKTILNSASLVVPDGAGLLWAADFLGNPIEERIPGVILVQELCELAEKKQWKVAFIGGKPGIAKLASEKLAEKYKNIIFSNIENGYFKPNSDDEENIFKDLISAKPEILFVALGVPRQEHFITKLKPILKNTVAIGVGGSFDVISGTIPRAPVIMQRFGIEWLFRLYKEPFRFKRVLKIPKFVLMVLRHKWNN